VVSSPTLADVAFFVLQSPVADSKTIKAAYYNLMREYHPDQAAAASSSSPNGSIDTNEFCALLNDIYKVRHALVLLAALQRCARGCF
jgi:hypothetical protein